MDFPDGSGKESGCKIRDSGSISESEISLRKKMETHSSFLAWRIPWTEEPGGLQFMASSGVKHDCMTIYMSAPICDIYYPVVNINITILGIQL